MRWDWSGMLRPGMSSMPRAGGGLPSKPAPDRQSRASTSFPIREHPRMNKFSRLTVAMLLGASVFGGGGASATEITFYYPIAVGGPITKIVDGYVAEFSKAHPDITVKPVYTGSYQDSIVKAMTAAKAGNAPDVSVLLSTDMFTLIDNDLIVPYETIATTEADRDWIKSFYPAFMENSQADGKTWGIPFQRSTIVQYWNKDAFKAAGLDPEKPPKTWDEMGGIG